VDVEVVHDQHHGLGVAVVDSEHPSDAMKTSDAV
jgi:hypothetical protein